MLLSLTAVAFEVQIFEYEVSFDALAPARLIVKIYIAGGWASTGMSEKAG